MISLWHQAISLIQNDANGQVLKSWHTIYSMVVGEYPTLGGARSEFLERLVRKENIKVLHWSWWRVGPTTISFHWWWIMCTLGQSSWVISKGALAPIHTLICWLRGNWTEKLVKEHLAVIEWTFWLGNRDKKGPLGHLLKDIRHMFPL